MSRAIPVSHTEKFPGVIPMQSLFIRQAALLAILTSALVLAACNKTDASKAEAKTEQSAPKKEEKGEEEQKDEHGEAGRLKLSAEEINTAGIEIEVLQAQSLIDQVVLTATIRDQHSRGMACGTVSSSGVGEDGNGNVFDQRRPRTSGLPSLRL